MLSKHAFDEGYLAELLQESRRTLWESTRFNGILFDLLVRSSRRDLSRLWYAYLRKVDDAIDIGRHELSDRLEYLSRQESQVVSAYEGTQHGLREKRLEDFIVALASRDKPQQLRAPILDMLAAMRMDCRWPLGFPAWGDFEECAALEATAYLRALLVFCSPPEGLMQVGPIGTAAGVGAKIIHVLRDLMEDLREGRISVPMGDRRAFGLDDRLEPRSALLTWIGTKRTRAGDLLEAGKRELKEAALPFRYKLCFALLCAKYESYLSCPETWLEEGKRNRCTLIRALVFFPRFLAILLYFAYGRGRKDL
jgi:phytoene/squalene synthetase